MIGLDCETNKEWARKGSLRSIQLAYEDGHVSVFHRKAEGELWTWYKVVGETITSVGKLPENSVKDLLEGLECITQNGYFDHYVILRDLGVSVKVVGDTFILGVLTPQPINQRKNLEALARKYFDEGYEKGKYGNWEDFDWDVELPPAAIMYGARDAMATLNTYQVQIKEAGKYANEAYKLELEALPTLSRMRMAGLKVDLMCVERDIANLERKSRDLHLKMMKLRGAPVSVNSPKALSQWLFVEKGLKSEYKTATGAYSVSGEALESLTDPVIETILEAKDVEAQIKSARALVNSKDGFEKTSTPGIYEIHTDWRPLSVLTNGSRLYSKGSVGGLTWDFRKYVLPHEGNKFVFWDIVAFELMFLAFVAQETDLMEFYEKGGSPHKWMASRLFKNANPSEKEYEMAKTLTYAIMYGSEGQSFSRKFGISMEETRSLMREFLSYIPKIQALREEVHQMVRKSPVVRTPGGRFRHLNYYHKGDCPAFRRACREAFNYFAQSSAGDIMKRVLPILDKKLNALGGGMAFTVFDSGLMEVPKEVKIETVAQLVTESLKEGHLGGFEFRFKIGEGSNWTEAKNSQSFLY